MIQKLPEILQRSNRKNLRVKCTDLSGRRKNNLNIQVGDEVFIQKDINNKYDNNAIEIFSKNTGDSIGYIPAENAYELSNMLDKIKKEPLYEEEKFESHILYKFKEEKPFTIIKEGNTWIIKGERIEKLLKMTKFNTDESANRFANKLRKYGVDDELRKLGANEGDTIRILDFEFEYKE